MTSQHRDKTMTEENIHLPSQDADARYRGWDHRLSTCSRILDYQIAREFRFRPDYMGGRLATFDEKVREMIKDGWTPIGGPFVDGYGTGQAMVKISSENVIEHPTKGAK
jgi:hypothetical protein